MKALYTIPRNFLQCHLLVHREKKNSDCAVFYFPWCYTQIRGTLANAYRDFGYILIWQI